MNEILITVTAIFLILAVTLYIENNRLKIRLLNLEAQQKQRIKEVTTTENKTQRAVIKGKVIEQLYPLLKTCEHVSSDMRFLGQPIDYIIFDGLDATRDTEQPYIHEIIFMDVKTGKASLTKEQTAIKAAIEQGRVRWVTKRL